MTTYYFNYEFFVPSQGTIEVEAESFLEAIAKAREIDFDNEVDFSCDFNASTETRLYSIDCDDEEIARVAIPKSFHLWSWTSIDLLEQLDQAAKDAPGPTSASWFDAAVNDHCIALHPDVSEQVRVELEAHKMQMATVVATSSALPIRI